MNSIITGAGAALCLGGWTYFNNKQKSIINEIKNIETVENFEDLKDNKKVVLKYYPNIYIQWIELYKEDDVNVLKAIPSITFGRNTIEPSTTLVADVERVRKFKGGFLNLSDYLSLPIRPTNDVKYSFSDFDNKQVPIYRSGYDIATDFVSRKPNNVSINKKETYELISYYGNRSDPVYYLGNKTGDNFLFTRFGRDNNEIIKDEINEHISDYSTGKITCGVIGVFCVIGLLASFSN